MPAVADIEPHIEREFGSRLELLGFHRFGRRKWVRSQKQPLRELFVIGSLKGAQYSPIWGISCDCAPSYRSRTFRRQSSDKNAVMDLTIDPVDISGTVPAQAFSFCRGMNAAFEDRVLSECIHHAESYPSLAPS